MKAQKFLCAIVAGCFGSLACGQGKGVSDDVVKIGVMTDLSGFYSQSSGMGSVRAAEMAVQDFGGKVLGKQVEVIYFDHQNKADIGSAKAREWMDTGKVDMILDLVNSSVAIAVQNVAADKKRMTMVTAGGTVALTNKECSPYGVHYAYDTYALATGTASAIVKEGGKSWFILTADYTFGHALERDFRNTVEKLGGKVIGSTRHPLNAPDFSSYILTAQVAKADVVALANAAADFANSVHAAREFGLVRNGKPILAGGVVLLHDVKALGLDIVQGMNYIDPWYWDFDERTREWSRKFHSVMKTMPSFGHAANYSAVTQYLKAIEAAGTDEPEAVMKQLRSTRFDDFFLRNAYLRSDGRMVRDMYLMEAKKPSESKGEWDLAKIKHVIAGEDAFMPLSQSACPLVKKQ